MDFNLRYSERMSHHRRNGWLVEFFGGADAVRWKSVTLEMFEGLRGSVKGDVCNATMSS